MKTQPRNIREQDNSNCPKIQKDTPAGGNALLTDNRSSTVYQRKLRTTMNASPGEANSNHGIENRTGIPNKLKMGFENISGYSMNDVRVHYNSYKPAQLQAHAYTQGTNVYIAPQQEKHLAHELGHVLQQKMDTVPTTNMLNGVPLNTDSRLEHQADMLGKKATELATFNHPLTGFNSYKNTSPGKQIIQRRTYPVTDYKDMNFFDELSLIELHEYANRQADWHASSLINNNDRFLIRGVLKFIRLEDYIFKGCGHLIVGDLLDELDGKSREQKNEVMSYLNSYSLLASQSYPFKLSETVNLPDLKDCISIGKKIHKLKRHFPQYVLRTAMYEEPFNALKEEDVDKLVDYYENAEQTPTFQSYKKEMNGNDFGAYILLNSEKYPLDYDKTDLKGSIRNYHRFEKSALDKLDANMKDTSKAKPLTLILHSAIDRNGAFIRDKKLTALINNNNLHVIMIEGFETLSEYKNQIQPLAEKYGRNNKIDQVMFAGHGNSRSLQLGGKIGGNQYGEIQEINDGIDLDNNMEASMEIFDEVLDNMNHATDEIEEPHRRILFNACLTNSNQLPPYSIKVMREGRVASEIVLDLETKENWRNHYREWLSNNKNLVNTVIAMAREKNVNLEKVVGSVASHGTLDMFDANNNLELLSTYDPHLTSENRLNYVKKGKDPEGVIRVIHELWVTLKSRDKADYATLAATFGYKSISTTIDTLFHEVKRRAGKKINNWREIIIQSCCYWLTAPSFWRNSNYILGLSHIAGILDRARIENECNTNKVSQVFKICDDFGISYNHISYIINNLTNCLTWNHNHFIPLVFSQLWMGLNSSNQIIDNFIRYVSGYANIKELLRFINVEYLTNTGFINKILQNKNNPGELRIALVGALRGETTCINFLKGHLEDGNFPDELNIETILGNVITKIKLMEILGVHVPPTETNANDAIIPENIRPYIDKAGILNTTSVESVTKKGVITGNTFIMLNVDRDPEKIITAKGTRIMAGTICHILGSKGKWWAIEYTYKKV
ncbi:MAG: DUF4157 domain-containing protein, partial [Bacteroidales bacterium]|nr:DUF4157 domain-containing protein [Bacteroidales bacterium]